MFTMSRKEREKRPRDAEAAESAFETEEPKSNRKYLYILLYVAVFAFAVYAVITLVSLHSQINEKKQELSEIQGEITVQEIKNDDMSKMYNYTDDEFSDYVEQIARDDLDFVRSGERVFVNVSGD